MRLLVHAAVGNPQGLQAEDNTVFGVGISLRPGSLDVADLFPGGSAEQSGSVRVGDEIVSVEGQDSISGDRARKLMRGRCVMSLLTCCKARHTVQNFGRLEVFEVQLGCCLRVGVGPWWLTDVVLLRVGTYVTIGFRRYEGDNVRHFKVQLSPPLSPPPSHFESMQPTDCPSSPCCSRPLELSKPIRRPRGF